MKKLKKGKDWIGEVAICLNLKKRREETTRLEEKKRANQRGCTKREFVKRGRERIEFRQKGKIRKRWFHNRAKGFGLKGGKEVDLSAQRLGCGKVRLPGGGYVSINKLDDVRKGKTDRKDLG